MFRRSTTVLLAVLCVTASIGFAQGTGTPTSQAPAGPIRPSTPPLFFRETWKDLRTPDVIKTCASNVHGHLCEPALTQRHVSNPNLELMMYGGGKQRLEDGQVLGAVLVQSGNHLWTGMTEAPFAVAFRDKKNYVDLSGLGKVHWAAVRASGLHVVHLIIRLADGTWLLGEHGYGGNQLQVRPVEFTVSDPEKRWMKLDIDRVVTLGPREPEPVDFAKARKIDAEMSRYSVWLDVNRVDLTKVDAVGFADLMPGSGHGYGGFISMAGIEVYGKPVPR
jgi:hypothetical protein